MHWLHPLLSALWMKLYTLTPNQNGQASRVVINHGITSGQIIVLLWSLTYPHQSIQVRLLSQVKKTEAKKKWPGNILTSYGYVSTDAFDTISTGLSSYKKGLNKKERWIFQILLQNLISFQLTFLRTWPTVFHSRMLLQRAEGNFVLAWLWFYCTFHGNEHIKLHLCAFTWWHAVFKLQESWSCAKMIDGWGLIWIPK